MDQQSGMPATISAARSSPATQQALQDYLQEQGPASLRAALTALRQAYPRVSIAERVGACVRWHEQQKQG